MVMQRLEGSGAVSLAGRRICIVGPRRLQNTLLAQVLSAALGVSCDVRSADAALPPHPAATTAPGLLLEDCLDREAGDVDALLADRCAAIRPTCLVCLFNLRGCPGVESVALRHGVRGFFYEHDSPEAIVKGVTLIFAGELWMSRKAIAACLLESGGAPPREERRPGGLTVRENEILECLALGETNERIADRMCISTHTVKTHLYNLYRKINVENRLQAARWLRTPSYAPQKEA